MVYMLGFFFLHAAPLLLIGMESITLLYVLYWWDCSSGGGRRRRAFRPSPPRFRHSYGAAPARHRMHWLHWKWPRKHVKLKRAAERFRWLRPPVSCPTPPRQKSTPLPPPTPPSPQRPPAVSATPLPRLRPRLRQLSKILLLLLLFLPCTRSMQQSICEFGVVGSPTILLPPMRAAAHPAPPPLPRAVPAPPTDNPSQLPCPVSLMSINCNGLASQSGTFNVRLGHTRDKRLLLTEIVNHHEPTFLALQETWHTEDGNSMVIPG